MRPLLLPALLLIACGGKSETGTTPNAGSSPVAVEPDACIGPPGLLDFGNTLQQVSMTVPITNKTDTDLVIDSVEISGNNYQVTTALPLTIPPRGTVGFDLAFNGQQANSAEDLVAYAGSVAVATAEVKANNCIRGLPEVYDKDGDGVCSCGGDCDDQDPAVGPGAPEVAGNGVDDDCDGQTDEPDDAPDTDDDGDGFSEQEGDCDDENDQVYPGRTEVNDRRDDNCDGVIDDGHVTQDDDGDGFTDEGGDCDDLAPDINPCAIAKDDLVDWDCDDAQGL